MRRIVDQYHERLLIGELYLPIERLMSYYGVDGGGMIAVQFSFDSCPLERQTDRRPDQPL